MFGMSMIVAQRLTEAEEAGSKIVAQRPSEAEEAGPASVMPLQTTVSR